MVKHNTIQGQSPLQLPDQGRIQREDDRNKQVLEHILALMAVVKGLAARPWPPRWWHSSSHCHLCLVKHVRATTRDEPSSNGCISFDAPPARARPVTVNQKPFNTLFNEGRTTPKQQRGLKPAAGWGLAEPPTQARAALRHWQGHRNSSSLAHCCCYAAQPFSC